MFTNPIMLCKWGYGLYHTQTALSGIDNLSFHYIIKVVRQKNPSRGDGITKLVDI